MHTHISYIHLSFINLLEKIIYVHESNRETKPSNDLLTVVYL